MHVPKLVAALVIALPLAVAPMAAQAAAVAGTDYLVLATPQPTESKGKVEVIEFFAYTCPHCFQFEPTLEAWAKKLPKNVELKQEPVIFSDSWEPMARAYFALRDMGALPRLHMAVFNAIHQENQRLMVPDVFYDWGAKQGLDRAKLKATYESFAVSAEIARAKAMARSYHIDGVPSLAVNGKYVTSASMTGSYEKSLAVADDLIRMESKTSSAPKATRKAATRR